MRLKFGVLALCPMLALAGAALAEENGTASDPAIAAIDAFIEQQNVDTSRDGWKLRLARPPQQNFDPEREYFWTLRTNKGAIKIELMPQVAPMHVTSTIYLTRLGFYDDCVFHRVIPGFMAQGGDPTGTGMSGPGYEYDGEFSPDVRHDRGGLLSMANAGPGTDGSQFFLTFVPTPHLDGAHTIFGQVNAGRRVLDKLEEAGTRSGRPLERLVILDAKITHE